MSDSDDLEAEIREQFEKNAADGEYDQGLQKFMKDEVIPVWQNFSPEASGAYKESVEVKSPAQGGKGTVGTSIGYAHIIEYGSIHNPEFEPRAKTEAYFATNPDSVG